MQTAFHITSLVSELKREAVGGLVVGTEFYKKERAAFVFIKKDKNKVALGFVYHPAGFGTFVLPASKVKMTTREKPWPIFDLEGAEIKAVRQLGFDRILEIEIHKDNVTGYLVYEALGPNGNIWLLDSDYCKAATLRKRIIEKREKYAITPLTKSKLNPLELNHDSLEQLVESNSSLPLAILIERNIVGCNRTLSREIVKRAGLGGDVDLSETRDIANKLPPAISDMASLFESPAQGYLYTISGGLEPYPFKLKSVDQQPEKFKSLSMAMMEVVTRRQVATEQDSEERTIKNAVKRHLKRLEKRVVNLEGDVEKAADYELYKKFGELIQINLVELKKGMTEATLDDLYAEGATVTVKLDPAMTPAENAEAYFKKHRKGREGLALLKRRLEITQAEVKQWQAIAAELEDSFDAAFKRNEPEIQNILPKAGEKQVAAVRLPYREYILSSGATLFVGKDGADNDRTTFEFARPYELWFHTQQCPGSHVVIKSPNKSFEPSKMEIEEAAAIAAWFSKARKNKLVPVIYTQRKYVRKPRKAKPGLVTVEREKSVMVEPRKPE